MKSVSRISAVCVTVASMTLPVTLATTSHAGGAPVDCYSLTSAVTVSTQCDLASGATVNFSVQGANGGGSSGGRGALITGSYTNNSGVTETLYLTVGQDGTDTGNSSGGGGYSSISKGSATTNPIAIAGGGGGYGQYGGSGGNAGGGVAGTDGAGDGGNGCCSNGKASGDKNVAGLGGTSPYSSDEDGGAGGAAGVNGSPGKRDSRWDGGSGAGGGGFGGSGGTVPGCTLTGRPNYSTGVAAGGTPGGGAGCFGGGGGGGWAGGGGGGGGPQNNYYEGGGGGAGSSLVPAGGSMSASITGSAQITMSTSAPLPPPTTTAPTTTTTSVAPLTELGPIARNSGMGAGQGLATVNGSKIAVKITKTNQAITMTGSGFLMRLLGYDEQKTAGQLDSLGRLILQAGGFTRVSGEGFAPNSDVQVYLFSEPVLLGVARTDTKGAFTKLLPIPASTPPGGHTIQANGFTSDGKVRSLNLGVIIPKLTLPATL